MAAPHLRFDHSRDFADQVAERLTEAAQTLAALSSAGTRPASPRSNWPDTVPDAEDLLWPLASDERLPRPTAAQVERMDEALSWLSLIPATDLHLRRTVNLRLIVHPISGMNRYSWGKIGGQMGCSDNTAKNRHRQACELIAKKIVAPAFSASLSSVYAS